MIAGHAKHERFETDGHMRGRAAASPEFEFYMMLASVSIPITRRAADSMAQA